jgi:hypothetical protein
LNGDSDANFEGRVIGWTALDRARLGRRPERVFRDAGGHMLGEGFLTPETIRSVEPELAAMSDAIAATEREGAQA